jgi:hypothetical protein
MIGRRPVRSADVGARFRVGRVRHFVIMAVMAGALCGCNAPPRAAMTATIAPDLRFALPSPRELGYRMSAVQLVTARYGGDTQVFEAHVTVSPERLTFIGLDPFGRRALTVTLDDSGMDVERAPGLPEALRAENILADVAIVYWPEAAVKRGLSQSGAELRADAGGRSIIAGGREVIRVDYGSSQNGAWAGTARYRNIAFGYELDLRSEVDGP